jgi:hypothetical protein
MLDVVLWIVTGWLLGVSVAAALGARERMRLAWNGALGIAASCLAGWLLAPAFNIPAGGMFSLGALSVAAVSCILLVLMGNIAAWLARRIHVKDRREWQP